jgi:DNA polymerase I-like protein with 3'-5' exonuclease and polymerase domains
MDLFDFLQESTSLKVAPKSWMQGGDYTLARATNETLPGIINDCIASGRYALDLETTGLDSRVFDGETVSKIVGCCLSPDGKRGYYIPLRHRTGIEHNVSWSLWKREMARLIASPAVAVFHNGKFDQEFLQNCGGEPLGEWDEPKKWDDTLILAYLRDTRSKTKGLKHLSKTELGMEMIELDELFPEDKKKQGLDFSELDPSWEPVTWYGASDAICTWNLYQKLAPEVLEPSMGVAGQNVVYAIEKLCVASTRWMERARILTDQEKAKELIRIGQREWIAALEEVYESSSSLLDRDIRPGYYRVLRGSVEGLESLRFDPEVVSPSYTDRIETARTAATKAKLDPMKEKGKVATVTKRVASITTKGVTEDVEFPVVYDVLSAQQLGKLLRECKVPGLTATEKSGQVDTSKDTLEEVLEKVGDKFPFAGKIKRFREVSKALSTYLLPIIEDAHTDGTLRAYFNAHSIETGRFNAPSSKDPKVDGGTRFPFHGTPATYDPNRPACLARVRECIIARPGKVLAACVAEGELVHTDRGFLPVEEVRAGDRVVTDDGPKDVRWAGATGTKPVLKLNTSRGVSLRLTADHRVYTVGDGGFGWKPVTELAPGDWVVHAWDHVVGGAVRLPPTPALTPHEKPIKTPDTLTGDLAEFLGRFMGDGCVGHDNGLARYVGLSLGTDCDELLHHVNRQADHLFGVAFTARDRGDVYCWSNPLCRWVNGVTGKGLTDARGLRVPECILKGGSNTHGLFLRGLFDADGSVGKRSGDGVTLWVTSERMSLEVQVLLAGLGVHARRVRAERTTNFGHIVGYVITVAGNRPLKRFRDAVGFTTRRKREALDALVAEPRNRDYSSMVPLALAKKAVRKQREAQTNRCLNNGSRMGRVTYESLEACRPFPQDTDREWLERLLDGQMFFDTIESIAPDGVAAVYDLHVPEGSRFTVNSVVVHNCDFSGVELRIVTNLSGEGKWLREFFHCSGCDRMFPMPTPDNPIPVAPPPYCPDCGSDKIGDLHTLTALAVYGEDAPKRPEWKQLRGFAKACNFALCYGGGGNAVVTAVGCDKNEGWRIKEQFDKTYGTLSGWWKLQALYAKKHKFVTTAFGRRCPLPDIDHELGGFRAKAERNAVNAPIQGTSADITKIAMGLVYKECKQRGWLEKVHMLITMHDELVFEIDRDILEEAIDLFVGLMCRNPLLQRLGWAVPLTSDVEMGPDWTVPWDLKKIRKKGECPPELDGCFKGIGPKVDKPKSQPTEKTAETPTVTHKLKSFSLGEVEALAQKIAAGARTPTARVKVLGPNDEDLTAVVSTVWGGKLPMVGGPL